MDSLRKEITHFYTRDVNGEACERSSSVTKRHFICSDDNTALSFWLRPRKRIPEPTPLCWIASFELFSSYTRLLSLPICLRINLVYCAETRLPPQSCLTIQFAGSAHPLLDYPELSYMCHSSLQSDMHSMLQSTLTFNSLFLILMTDLRFSFENFAKTAKYYNKFKFKKV